jgi:hypothetical protein
MQILLGSEPCMGACVAMLIGWGCMYAAHWTSFDADEARAAWEIVHLPLRQKQDDLIGTSALATAFANWLSMLLAFSSLPSLTRHS